MSCPHWIIDYHFKFVPGGVRVTCGECGAYHFHLIRGVLIHDKGRKDV